MNQKKIAVLISIIIVLTGFIDTKFDLLQDAGLTLVTINRIKLIGLALSSVLPSISTLFSNKID
ncbi:hypothetical protein GKZ90_0012350 [Flavobacterium sp. MC2016-06]|jgi:hypothetical protein|uniref:hypothetical protein n=1 Tax=Flavobacterium sp. MC2016-06 TaxID=2676308 RepID=UPI0012BA6AC7|nr:hypothetical protein [Flavobacterium sp. MC2016-06]MBU3862409.1 hypothetical protein [Flavobacterium sp. MC2016-06]